MTMNDDQIIESMEYNNILMRMKNGLKNPTTKTEGAFAMDALQAVAQEVSRLCIMELADFIDQVFIDTAKNEYLDRKALDLNMIRTPSTPAVGVVTFKGKAGTVIPKGIGVIGGDLVYTTDYMNTIPESGVLDVSVTCLSAGQNGNLISDSITGIRIADSIEGVTVSNSNSFEGGTDEEEDEHFRKRIYDKIQLPISSGNVNNYIYWAKSISGVGNARCIPLWDGAGTVKVIILSTEGSSPSDAIIDNVKEYVEKVRPVGANVTVTKALPKSVSVTASISLNNGYQLQEVINTCKKNIKEYLTTIAFDSKEKRVSYYKISDILFNCDGVKDVIDYTINDHKDSVTATSEEFFDLEEVILNVH